MAATRLTEPQAGELGPTGRPYSAFPDPEPLVEHGPARVIAVCNQKGGVGKTTTTINLGAALAEQGRRVLLVDFDPQGALSVGLGIQPHDIDNTVYNLLMERDVTAHDVLFKTSVDGLDLMPSNIDLSGAEVQLVHEVGREYVLGGVLQPLMSDYDMVMIDCQPSLGLLTINALACADSVVIPMECEYFAMRGVALLMETIDKVSRRLNPKLTIDGLARHDVRLADASYPRGPGQHGQWFRRQGFSYCNQPHGEVPGRYGGRRAYYQLRFGINGGTLLPGAGQGGTGAVAAGRGRSRRVSLPGVAELLRPAGPRPSTRTGATSARPADGKGTPRRSPSTCPPRNFLTWNEPASPCCATVPPPTGAGSSGRRSPSCSPTSTPAARTASSPAGSPARALPAPSLPASAGPAAPAPPVPAPAAFPTSRTERASPRASRDQLPS